MPKGVRNTKRGEEKVSVERWQQGETKCPVYIPCASSRRKPRRVIHAARPDLKRLGDWHRARSRNFWNQTFPKVILYVF